MNTRATFTLPPEVGEHARRAFEQLRKAFPRRALRVDDAGTASVPMMIFLGLLLSALGGGLFAYYAPGMAADYRISKHPEVVADAETSGMCKSRKFVFIECDIKITYRSEEGGMPAHAEQEIMFLGDREQSVNAVLRHSSNPAMVTTDLAIDKLLNRFLTATALCGLLVAIGVASLFRGWSHFKAKQAAKRAGVLTPVLVQIKEINKHRYAELFFYKNGKKSKGQFRVTLDGPYIMAGESNVALGVMLPEVDHCVLLDTGLANVSFTEQERALLKAALAGENVEVPARTVEPV